MEQNKWAIQLRLKYTGECIFLGGQYNTYEEAQEWSKKICNECNDIMIMPIGLNCIWKNKKEGFISEKIMEENKNGIKRNINR